MSTSQYVDKLKEEAFEKFWVAQSESFKLYNLSKYIDWYRTPLEKRIRPQDYFKRENTYGTFEQWQAGADQGVGTSETGRGAGKDRAVESATEVVVRQGEGPRQEDVKTVRVAVPGNALDLEDLEANLDAEVRAARVQLLVICPLLGCLLVVGVWTVAGAVAIVFGLPIGPAFTVSLLVYLALFSTAAAISMLSRVLSSISRERFRMEATLDFRQPSPQGLSRA